MQSCTMQQNPEGFGPGLPLSFLGVIIHVSLQRVCIMTGVGSLGVPAYLVTQL